MNNHEKIIIKKESKSTGIKLDFCTFILRHRHMFLTFVSVSKQLYSGILDTLVHIIFLACKGWELILF